MKAKQNVYEKSRWCGEHVHSAGNTGLGPCSVEYPAFLPYVISVGALGTALSSTPYTNTGRYLETGFNSAYGKMAVTGGSGSTVYVPAISVMAPGNIRFRLGSGTSGTSSYLNFKRTSAATPIAAGVGALTLEWLRDNSISTSPRTVETVHATMGVFGDGANSSTTKTRIEVDDQYGFGRIKAQLPQYTPSGEPGSINKGSIVWKHGTISSGQVIRWYVGNFPGTRKGLKSTLIVDDPGNNNWNVPNFRFRIVDACNGYAVLKEASANDYLKKRIRVYDASKLVTGICPYAEIELLDSGFTNVEYATASYTFGGSWDYH